MAISGLSSFSARIKVCCNLIRNRFEMPNVSYTQPLPTSLRKKDSDMKIDKTTYEYRKERPIGMTADHTSRPDKVLFFADLHFLFLESTTKMAHYLLPNTQVNVSQKSKSHFSLCTKRINLQIKTLKSKSYGNN